MGPDSIIHTVTIFNYVWSSTLVSPWLQMFLWWVCACACVFVCVRARLSVSVSIFLMPTRRTQKIFGPRFTTDRGEIVTHILVLPTPSNHITGCKYDISRMTICMYCIVLWCNIWVMKVSRGREKMKPGVVISLLLPETTKGPAGLTPPIRRTIHYQQNICTRSTLGFYLGIFGTKTIDWGSTPSSFLIPVSFCLNGGQCFLFKKNTNYIKIITLKNKYRIFRSCVTENHVRWILFEKVNKWGWHVCLPQGAKSAAQQCVNSGNYSQIKNIGMRSYNGWGLQL